MTIVEKHMGKVPRVLIGLGHPDSADVLKVGNKFSGIARLHKAGFPVPPAYSIPASFLSDVRITAAGTHRLPEGLIAEAMSLLNPDAGIAVRSSGFDEDLPTASGAGKYRSVLDVKDPGSLSDAILSVLSHYRGLQERSGAVSPGFSIFLQQMIHPSLSGVAFSRHPLRREEDAVIVEAVEGLGDKLVSGEARPIRLILEREPDPSLSLRSDAGSLLLDHEQLREIRDTVRRVEELWGCPVDVEWGISRGRLLLLQARPATALSQARPSGSWTRGIAEDLWGDELCPLDASILLRLAPGFDLREFVRRLGIPVPDADPSLAVIEGHLYVNADLLSRVIRSFPRGLDLSAMRRIFPPGKIPEPSGRLWPLLGRAALLFLSDLRVNPFLCPGVTERKRRRILEALVSRKYAAPTDLSGLAKDLEFLVSLEGDLLEANQMPYFFAFVLTWAIEHRFRQKGIAGLGSLLAGLRKNPAYRMNLAIRDLGKLIEKHPLPDGHEDRFPQEVETALEAFLREFGARSDSRSLSEPRWAEDADKVIRMAKRAASRVPPTDIPPPSPELPFPKRSLIALAGRYLELREELRDTLDRVLWAQRRVLLDIDRRIGLQGSVFSCTLDQVLQAATEGANGSSMRSAPISRRKESPVTGRFPPMYFIDGCAVEVERMQGSLSGIPTCAGRARGKARVVTSLREAADAGRGDIVIARAMGPSWVSILPGVAGVLLAEGSMLDHFSIVAREYRVPCIVGMGNGVLEIPDGKTIEMDGYEGTVRISP